jgi:NAD(P)-dependent dehydrogenase (short-subunit alcohol dehydrogenase family)
LIAEFDFDVDQLFLLSKSKQFPTKLRDNVQYELVPIQKYSKSVFAKLEKRAGITANSRILIINFAGTLGNVINHNNLEIANFYETFESNLNPFLNSLRLFDSAGEGSLYITFSGAGVGGDNVDDTSLGYLSAKCVMALLVETLDRKFKSSNKRLSGVAPGAFPSRMQQALLDEEFSGKVDQRRIEAAKKLFEQPVSSEKLIRTISYMLKNPEDVGGRILSANHDDLESVVLEGNFGRLRRVTN